MERRGKKKIFGEAQQEKGWKPLSWGNLSASRRTSFRVFLSFQRGEKKYEKRNTCRHTSIMLAKGCCSRVRDAIVLRAVCLNLSSQFFNPTFCNIPSHSCGLLMKIALALKIFYIKRCMYSADFHRVCFMSFPSTKLFYLFAWFITLFKILIEIVNIFLIRNVHAEVCVINFSFEDGISPCLKSRACAISLILFWNWKYRLFVLCPLCSLTRIGVSRVLNFNCHRSSNVHLWLKI